MNNMNKVCTLLGIKYPIFQGGMAWVSTSELVIAVSEAGVLGIIGSGMMDPDVLESELLKVKVGTEKPFGVNLMLMMHPRLNELVEVILRNPPAVVTTGAGNPGLYIQKFKEKGIKVIPVVPSVALALRMEKLGADAVIVEGMESGGHVGELTTMTLVPQVVDVVNIPVIAAGGIADGRGIAAAFALGALGVQIGTLFLAATETPIQEAIKIMIVNAKDRDTTVTGRSTGHPVRVIKNKLSREIDNLDRKNKPKEIDLLGKGSLRRAMQEGDTVWGSVMAGQIAGLVKEIKPVKEIIDELVDGYKETVCSLPKALGDSND